jgi:hypothetical protein
MVCLCGRSVLDRINSLLDQSSQTVTIDRWRFLPMEDLYDDISGYNTFKSMIHSLRQPKAHDAVCFLRSFFSGYLGEVVVSYADIEIANFLTSEGVLLKPDLKKREYRMASPLIDGLIRTTVIPHKFPNAPSTVPAFQDSGDSLHVLNVLIECLKFFDKELMRMAPNRSYKSSTIAISGFPERQVPRESVYDTELMRILTNWLGHEFGWTVTGQYHLVNEDGRHRYSDIILRKNAKRIVLELLATGDRSFVRKHINKTPEYMALNRADQAWVIHFTCEKNYNPIWQSKTQLSDGLNVVHLEHNREFTKVRIRAWWMDDGGDLKDYDELLTI